MIMNQKCETCQFANKCLAKVRLKPFSDEAKKDLGVTLNFVSCDSYKAAKVTASEDTPEENK